MQEAKHSADSIHPQAAIGHVALTVADLQRSLVFYEQIIGFERIQQTDQTAVLGVAGVPLLHLIEKQGAVTQPDYSTGLYHVAILLPSRVDLAREIQHLIDVRYPLQGYADHLVSEAFYLADPDGNGLEIYRDRPRSEWRWSGSTVRMASDPIDFDSFFGELNDSNRTWTGLPASTRIGHIHLRAADVAQAKAFYHDILGFDVTAQMPGAIFLSAGGYHHHLGANTWQSRGAPPAPENSVGLQEFTVTLPDEAERERIAERLMTAGIAFTREGQDILLRDPWQNQLRLKVGGA